MSGSHTIVDMWAPEEEIVCVRGKVPNITS